jgi:hypothetical protein
MRQAEPTEEKWIRLTDYQIKMALLEIDTYEAINRKHIRAEAVRRGILHNIDSTVRACDINISFRSMVELIFKWMFASIIASIPFAIIVIAIVIAVSVVVEFPKGPQGCFVLIALIILIFLFYYYAKYRIRRWERR